jgi:cytidine deaminase
LTWSDRGIRRVKRVLEALGLDVRGTVEIESTDLVGREVRAVFQSEEREDPLNGRRICACACPTPATRRSTVPIRAPRGASRPRWTRTRAIETIGPMPGPEGSASRPIEDADDLMRVAHAAAALAYAPYSGIHVGAALLARDGQVYTGCNVENASFGLTICAERSALVKAVAAGERQFRAIAIATDRPQASCRAARVRQVLFEFAPELVVMTQGRESTVERATLTELLPRAFAPGDVRQR